MLKLDDIVALAKSGYKVSDVKELIELSKEAEASTDVSKDTVATEESVQEDTHEESLNNQPEDTKEEAEADKIVDYKAKVEELEEKIRVLQKANTEKKIADTDEKSDSDVLAEAMKSFM